MVNQYKLECYVPDGESMRIDTVYYADTQEEAYQKYVHLVSMKNDHGEREYISVRLYVAAYKQIQDPNEFFSIFKAQ